MHFKRKEAANLWEMNSNTPIYLQLIDHIKMYIASGWYSPGDRLPSVRDLSLEAAVNPNTMQKALQSLEQAGFIYTNRTSGKFITDNIEMINELRTNIATVFCEDFVSNAKKIGYDNEAIIQLVKEQLN